MNKSVRHLILCVTAVFSLVACEGTAEQPGPDVDGPVDVQPDLTPEYLLDIPSPSFVGGDVVQEGDTLGVIVVKGDDVYLAETEVFVSGGSKLAFEYDKSEGIVEGDQLFVYSPFTKEATPENPSAVSFSIPAVQKQIGGHFAENHLPRVSLPFKAEYALPTGRKVVACTLPLHPLYSIVEFKISSTKSKFRNKSIASVTYNSEGVSGDFVYNLTSDELAIPALNGNSVTTELSDIVMPKAEDSFVSVYMAVAPGKHAGALKIQTEAGAAEVQIPEIQFRRDTLNVVPVVLSTQSPSEPKPDEPDDPSQDTPTPDQPDNDDSSQDNPEQGDDNEDKEEDEGTGEDDDKGDIGVKNGNETFKPLEKIEW